MAVEAMVATGNMTACKGCDGQDSQAGDEDAVEALTPLTPRDALLHFLEQGYLALIFVLEYFHI